MDIGVLLIVWIVLLGLKGFFSGAEIAIVNADRLRLQTRAEQGHGGSQVALRLLQRPERLLTTTLVGTNIATVALAVLTTTLFLELYGEGGDLIALLVGTPLMLIFGEIVPKSVYQQSADSITPVISRLLRLFSWLFLPVVLVFSSLARLLAVMFIGQRSSPTLLVVREQLRALIDMSERASDVTVFDRVRIKNVIRFADITVGEVMTPVTDVTGISRQATVQDVIATARKTGFRHFPVFEGTMSNVIGTVCVSTWELVDPGLTKKTLDDMVTEPLYVTGSEPVEDLLSQLRARDDQMAVVVDEYESAVGMVTVQDVTRQIVGEIGSRAGAHKRPSPTPAADGATPGHQYDIDAQLRISQLNDLLGTDLTSETFHTVGGLMAARLRRIPAVGDTVEANGYRFTVTEGSKRGPSRIRVEYV